MLVESRKSKEEVLCMFGFLVNFPSLCNPTKTAPERKSIALEDHKEGGN